MNEQFYRTSFVDISSVAPFDSWDLSEIRLDSGRLMLDGTPRGVAESPVIESPIPFSELIPSWNGSAPGDSWIRVSVSVLLSRSASGAEDPAVKGEHWTAWYGFGRWTEGVSAEAVSTRHSEGRQEDSDAAVAVDTLRLKVSATAFKVRVELWAGEGCAQSSSDTPGTQAFRTVPQVRFLGAALSTDRALPRRPLAGDSKLWKGPIRGVPQRSQMVFPDGGDVWCSPTSLSMVMGYWWGEESDRPDRVKETVAGVWDASYEGHGNWAFNVAHAGSLGFRAQILRFPSLACLEGLLAEGYPLVLSVSWNNEDGRPLDGAPLASSRGHLTVIVGFDEGGDPLMNEPAAPHNPEVRRIYSRSQLEARWQEASGGTVYLVYPEDKSPTY